ncbi:uncharacterized protein [Watersipora subatra]|uniref:uncharacterized protein n=1 Tax=Watersipora subatra TaxID=2589382 RepID=UPI00355B4AFD
MGGHASKPKPTCRQWNKGCICHLIPLLLKLRKLNTLAFVFLLARSNGDCETVINTLEALPQKTKRSWFHRILIRPIPYEPKLGDRLVTHNPWDKQNVLSRHYKTFPLQILLHKFLKASKFVGSKQTTSKSFQAIFEDQKLGSEKNSGKKIKKKTKKGKARKTTTDTKELSGFKDRNLSHASVDCHENMAKAQDCCGNNMELADTDELRKVLDLGKSWADSTCGIYRDQLVYVIAGYPENQNQLISLCIQEKLGRMSPKEYRTYVLTELTLEERESLLVDEKERRKTFLAHWSFDGNLCAEKMAQAGFYCLGVEDKVQCVFCRGSMKKWSREDNPMAEHAKAFAFCRFVKGLDCGNREYRNTLLSSDELKNLEMFPQLETKKNRDGSISVDCDALGINTKRAAVIKYAPEATRIKTFARWPASSPINSSLLCSAGFYYTGFDDSVRCFYCIGSLKGWNAGDDPWIEHARWFPYCSYLLQLKGQQFVDEIHASTSEGNKYKRSTIKETKQAKEINTKRFLEEEMMRLAVKLGHKQSTVARAVELNGGPFKSISELLADIYKREETSNLDLEPQALPKEDAPKKMVIAEEDEARIVTDAVQYKNASSDLKAPAGCCLICYNKVNQPVNASYVGLPCGHLLYCDKCNAQEVKRSENPAYKSKCPYQSCQGYLASTFKTFCA